jgi:hypothetical protein
MISALLDPGFWKNNWKTILAIGIAEFPVSDVAGIGGKIGVAILRPLGRVFERVLPGIAKDGLFAVRTLFDSGFKRIGTRIIDTLRGTATRFPNFFNRAWNTIEKSAVCIFHAIAGKAGGIIKDLFNTARKDGEQAFQSVGRSITRAIVKLGGFVLKVGIIKLAVDKVTGAFQAVIDKIKQAIGWVGTLAGKISNLPNPGGLHLSLPFHIPGTAAGGTTLRQGLQIVGEKGPEILNMPRGAQVIPLPRVEMSGLAMDAFSGQIVLQPNIYIGAQKLDERIDVRVDVKQRRTAQTVRAGRRWTQ